jgi:hypothetical protein
MVVVLVLVFLVSALVVVHFIRKAGEKLSDRTELISLGLLYHKYWDGNKKGPTTVDELATVAQANDSFELRSIGNLRSGKYVFYMDVDFPKLPAGVGKTVLGYEAKVPAEGGQVLMADGSVKDMTAGEFQTANKPPNAKLSKP